VADPSAAAGSGVLAALVGDPEAFATEHWGRAPLLRRAESRSVRGADVASPLTVEDVDHLLTSSGLRWPGFRLVREGRTLPRATYTRSGRIGGQQVTDLADAGKVLDLVADGATLVLQGLHRSHPPVADLCDALEAELGHPVQANAYLTPPGSRGLAVHHDTHDVFAVQTHGHKHWVVHEPAMVAPLPHQAWSSDRHEPGDRILDIELGPGDVLYLPRGAPHAAETVGEVSLHLTIGVRAVTWYDVLQRAARDLGGQPSLRESLPIRFSDDPEALATAVSLKLKEAADVLSDADADALVGALTAARHRGRRTSQRGRLTELVGLDHLDDDTLLRRADDRPLEVGSEDDHVVICLDDRDVRLPGALEPVLERLLDGREHRLGELSDVLDAEGRRVLARRLVREGVLRMRDVSRG
jgi:bifunctional lysine-specific demethylase and histidyl-hydroxylase NO66